MKIIIPASKYKIGDLLRENYKSTYIKNYHKDFEIVDIYYSLAEHKLFYKIAIGKMPHHVNYELRDVAAIDNDDGTHYEKIEYSEDLWLSKENAVIRRKILEDKYELDIVNAETDLIKVEGLVKW